MTSEKRKNPLIEGEFVIISPERENRPFAFIKQKQFTPPKNCPFCPGNESRTTPEILAYRYPGSSSNDSKWWVRFIPNKFPAVAQNRNKFSHDGLFKKDSALGVHEVGITREHDLDFGEPGFDDKYNLTRELLWAIHERKNGGTLNPPLSTQYPELKYALFFKNHESDAGGSLSHPHIQLLAIEEIPFRSLLEYKTAVEYSIKSGDCLLCSIIKEEMNSGDRIVDENNLYVVVEPFASRFPYETWIIPKEHEKSFRLSSESANSLSSIVKKTFSRINILLGNPAHNFYIHDSPLNKNGLHEPDTNGFYHWYIELSPRTTRLGGWEYGTGSYINPLLPEVAAERLRKVRTD